MEAVIVRNKGRSIFKDRFNGREYTISPGKQAAVPLGAAKLWLGDWSLTGSDLAADQRRARYRTGTLPNLEVVTDVEDAPSKEKESDDKK